MIDVTIYGYSDDLVEVDSEDRENLHGEVYLEGAQSAVVDLVAPSGEQLHVRVQLGTDSNPEGWSAYVLETDDPHPGWPVESGWRNEDDQTIKVTVPVGTVAYCNGVRVR